MGAYATLADLRTAVAAKGYTVDTEGIDEVINSAYREVLAARRWPFLAASFSSYETIVGAANTTAIVSGHINGIRIDDGDGSELEFLPLEELRRLQNEDTVLARPEYWTRMGNTVYVYPLADAVYSLVMDATLEANELVNPTDAILIPRMYLDTVVWGATAELAYRQRDYASGDRAEKKRDDAVMRMSRAYGLEQRQGGRRVRETGFWDDMA